MEVEAVNEGRGELKRSLRSSPPRGKDHLIQRGDLSGGEE